VVESLGEREESNLQNTVFALERSTLDSPVAPRRGLRTRLAGSQVFKIERLRPEGRRTARAGTAEMRFEGHRPIRGEMGLSLDLRAYGRFSSERILPLYERLPLGGANTLRGYDEEAFRVDRYGLSRLEWSRFLDAGGGRVFLFWDHAWFATRDSLPGGGDRLNDRHRDGIGFGLRLEAAGGVVGVDYGLEPGRPPLEGRVHLRLVSTF
jgi:hemolysin activation/secretion protein